MTQLRNHSIVRKASASSTQIADDWRDQSACRDADPELFFAHPTDTRGIAEALDHCQVCPVLQLCKEAAYQQREEYGIFGGETETERRTNLRTTGPRIRTIPTCGTEAGYAAHHRRNETACTACTHAATAARAARLAARGPIAATRIVTNGPGKCGEPRGYWRHMNANELPCEPCVDAKRANDRNKHANSRQQARETGEAAAVNEACGERRGYRRHRARGEEPCGPCVEANRAYNRSKRYPKRAA